MENQEENNENSGLSKEELEEEIAELMTRIRNTEYDLANMFKGNALIEQKLVNTKKTLEEKKKLLASLEPEKQKKFKEKEREILEEDKDEGISVEQEAQVEEQVEENLG